MKNGFIVFLKKDFEGGNTDGKVYIALQLVHITVCYIIKDYNGRLCGDCQRKR